MPKQGNRAIIFAVGTAIGVAVSGSGEAEPLNITGFTLAQNTQQQLEEEQRRRRGRNQEERQERRERVQQERQENQQNRQERRERVQQEQQQQQQQQQDDRQERRERVQQEQQKQREDAQDKRRERAQEEQQDRQKRRERAEERRDQAEGEKRRKERAEKREEPRERIESREISSEERAERRKERREFTNERLKDITRERRERRDETGRVIIEEPGQRRIIRDKGRVIIEHDETERLRGAGRNVRVEEGQQGRKRTIISRPNGVQIITIEDRRGRLLRRIKRLPNGREIVLINNEYERKRRFRDRDGPDYYIDLPDFVIGIPEKEYYVYADEADETEIEDVLTAEPVDELEEDYTLDEIRYSPDLRKRFRKLNLNTINFEFGSWEVREDQIDTLAIVAKVINRIVQDNPEEIMLIAGHTDSVGSEEDNLSLSDRRAETVARILTDEFGVPPENLVTQGYGESDLLINTDAAEVRNRRVEFMRITPYLAQKQE